jgi:phosphate transport system substrate-binding protein
MRTRLWRLAAVLAATSLFAAACGGTNDDATTEGASGGDATEQAADADEDTDATEGDTDEDTSAGGEDLSGTVQIDGSSTVGPLSEVAAELYMTESDNDVRVTVAISGTGGGFEKFCRGETDANNSSRPIKDSEIELCEENGIAYDFVQTANDALSLLVNNDFPAECITVEQANQIWDEGSAASVWGDIDGLVPDDFADTPITLYGPGTDSGTFDFFTEVINGEEGRIRTDYIDIGEDDNAALTAVEGDVSAMGYVPFSYFQEAIGRVKALQIDDGNGCVAAEPDNVQDGSYSPLGRGLFVYFSDTALARPEVLDFAEFYIDNSPQIAELAEFVPMTDEQLDEQRVKIDALAGN